MKLLEFQKLIKIIVRLQAQNSLMREEQMGRKNVNTQKLASPLLTKKKNNVAFSSPLHLFMRVEKCKVPHVVSVRPFYWDPIMCHLVHNEWVNAFFGFWLNIMRLSRVLRSLTFWSWNCKIMHIFRLWWCGNFCLIFTTNYNRDLKYSNARNTPDAKDFHIKKLN